MRSPTHETFWYALIAWFIDRKFIVAVFTLLLIGAGLYVSPLRHALDGLPSDPVPVDAIPDIGENQQIVFTTWAGRSPRDVEDQITYPLTTALLGIPGVRTIRSASALGFSTVYVIFDDSVDFYWSRSRVLEKLASLPPGTVPDGVAPTLGPDATALGQVFWYTLEGRDPEGRVVGGWDAHELRSVQDWTVRYALQSVEGVSEVASVGGHVREYQIDVDPEALRAHDVSIMQVAAAVSQANLDVGARTVEINRVEYLVRGLGFIREAEDLEEAVVAVRDNTPIRVRDVAHVGLGPANRRGALDDAGAPAVGGVVVARYLENPLAVIERVKDRIRELAPGLPRRTLEDGTVSQITVVPFYDRTQLIHETLDTLESSLLQEILITVIVVIVLLRDLRSSLVVSLVLPLGVLFAFIAMKYGGVDANIMALGGVAIAIGTMVDMGIVFTENVAQYLAAAPPERSARESVKLATAEVAPAVVTSVLTTVVSFIPVFGLTAAEARLFAPLAYAKTFAMGGALLLALLLLPSVAHLWLATRRTRGTPDRGGLAARLARRAADLDLVRELLVVALIVAWAYVARTPWSTVGASAFGLATLTGVGARWRGAKTLSERTRTGQLLALGATVLVELGVQWAPFGPARPLRNVLFATVVVGSLLGAFRLFASLYPRLLHLCLRHKLLFLSLPLSLAAFGLTAWLGFDRVFAWLPAGLRTSRPASAVAHALPGLGREYMPPFDEGAFLYMPSTMPHASFGEVDGMVRSMDARIAAIPEVDRVVGKFGRADSAFDPAPVSMVETLVTYVPEYRTEADGTRVRQWRDHIRSPRDIWDEIVRAAETPGVTSAPVLMPINARIVMLQSGMRAPLGIKVSGPTLEAIEQFGLDLEGVLRSAPGVRAETVFAERVVGKPYLEIELDRVAIARYGLSVRAVQDVLQVAVGGMTLTRTVEGRERYPVRVRLMREERDSVEALESLSIPTPTGPSVPLSELAQLRYVRGPQMIRAEDTFLTSYVLFDRQADMAEVEVVEAARAHVERALADGTLDLPAGVSYRFAGSYENQVRSEQRLAVLIPIALALVFVLLFLQFRRVRVSLMIYAGVLVAVSGAFVLLWLYGQTWFLDVAIANVSLRELFQVRTVNMSVAVWVGMIALVGVATDDGVVIATYLQQLFAERPPGTVDEVRALTLEAGERRVRACLMTTATTILALLPVITSQGRGADVMIPMALPSIGGMTFELITLFVVPVLYCAAEERRVRKASNTA